MSAMFTYTDEDTGLVFHWHGGEYIDVGVLATEDNVVRNNLGQPSHDPGELIAHECINVWDHAADEPRIDRTLSAFEQRCREWLAGDEDDDEEEDDEDDYSLIEAQQDRDEFAHGLGEIG